MKGEKQKVALCSRLYKHGGKGSLEGSNSRRIGCKMTSTNELFSLEFNLCCPLLCFQSLFLYSAMFFVNSFMLGLNNFIFFVSVLSLW